ncbi:MAG: hypothetical protein EPN47_15925 [Acidobacteria bacterium]|nr:MAG: hypothetical protein EPN47_15925 [Acidobacteriota bacterium]
MVYPKDYTEEDATWVDKDNIVIHIDGPGIYLTKASKIQSIMFLRAEENAASRAEASESTPAPKVS